MDDEKKRAKRPLANNETPARNNEIKYNAVLHQGR